MKKIKIDKVNLADKKSVLSYHRTHRVALGNHVIVCFENKRHLSNFMAETNEMLNSNLDELNSIYIDLWTILRINYQVTLKVSITNNFKVIEDCFSMVISRSHWENGNTFTFHYLDVILRELTEILTHIINFNHKEKHWTELKRLRVTEKRLLFINLEIKEWGKELAKKNPTIFGQYVPDDETYPEKLIKIGSF